MVEKIKDLIEILIGILTIATLLKGLIPKPKKKSRKSKKNK